MTAAPDPGGSAVHGPAGPAAGADRPVLGKTPCTVTWGVSHIYKVNVPVTEILAQKLPISIQMGVLAMLLSLVLGIPLGLVMGRCKNRWPDKLGTALIVLIQAVPAAVYFLYIQMYGTCRSGGGPAVRRRQLALLGAAGVQHEPGKPGLLRHVAAPLHGGREQQGLRQAGPCQGCERKQYRAASCVPQRHGAAGAVHSLGVPQHGGGLHLH